MNDAGVFFDCWDTVLEFKQKTDRWRIMPLEKHCINKSDINWDEVFDFSENFLREFYFSRSNYELTIERIYNLLCANFDIKLDTSTLTASDEVMDYLDPKPMDGIEDFLFYLDEKKILYAILSNTIYTAKRSKEIVDKFIPDNHFMFFFGSADVCVKKPFDLFFKAGVKYAKCDITKSVYIGDSYNADVFGSYNAGFKNTVWLNWKNGKRDEKSPYEDVTSKDSVIIVKSYKELLNKFKKGEIL